MNKKAFTLIEMAVVLTVIGLIIGASIGVLKSMREKAEITNAKQNVEAATNAIIGNALKNNNTLPPVVFFHKNLSPKKENEQPLLYVNDPQLEKINICSFKKTNLKVNTPDRGDIKNIAFVVVSASANHNLQTADKNGVVVVHAPYEKDIDDEPTPVNIPQNYDDIVKWVTLSELQQQLQCSHTGMKILNDYNLLNGIDSQLYGKSQIYVQGGTPFAGNKYKWCVEYSTGDDVNGWLKSDCDGNLNAIQSICSPTLFSMCKNFSLIGKVDKNASLGIHKITVYVKDQAETAITKSFTIKIDHDANTGYTSGGSTGSQTQSHQRIKKSEKD